MKFIAIACIWLVGAALAVAQTSEQSLAYLDRDRDGRLSLDEYLAYQNSRLAQFDSNANGKLSRDEFKASLAGPAKKNAQASFAAFDMNKDRALDSREFLGYHAYVFKNYVDRDRDGYVSLEELAALQAAAK